MRIILDGEAKEIIEFMNGRFGARVAYKIDPKPYTDDLLDFSKYRCFSSSRDRDSARPASGPETTPESEESTSDC